ncbi:MAG: hypothetical protein JOZ19_15165 [Rubrobacter sp.]|nr:hypothetical protein [Rubrobacter sp.]
MPLFSCFAITDEGDELIAPFVLPVGEEVARPVLSSTVIEDNLDAQ